MISELLFVTILINSPKGYNTSMMAKLRIYSCILKKSGSFRYHYLYMSNTLILKIDFSFEVDKILKIFSKIISKRF